MDEDSEADDSSTPGVAIVNQALVNKYFPGQDPIGQRIANDEGGRPSLWEIVGVVDDVHEAPLDEETWPAEYFPINQTMDPELNLAVRTRQDPGVLLPGLVTALHQLDPRLGVSEEATLTAKIGTLAVCSTASPPTSWVVSQQWLCSSEWWASMG